MSAPAIPATSASTPASASRVEKIVCLRKPIAFRIAISPIRSRIDMLAVFAAMKTMHRVTIAATIWMIVTSCRRPPKKFPTKLSSVSVEVIASLLRNISSIWRITGATRSGSSMRDQIMPVLSNWVPFAAERLRQVLALEVEATGSRSGSSRRSGTRASPGRPCSAA